MYDVTSTALVISFTYCL